MVQTFQRKNKLEGLSEKVKKLQSQISSSPDKTKKEQKSPAKKEPTPKKEVKK